MKVSLDWLKNYVDIENIDIKQFCSKMIMSGSNLDTYETRGEGVSGVVIGKIEKVEKHEDADKLKVCQVNVGNETIQIVTGAPNVAEGFFVPVAKIGSKLPIMDKEGKPLEIKKGKLRGVDSFGMMCGGSEIGFSDKVMPLDVKDGLWLIDGDYEDRLGENFFEVLKLKDYIVDFEITPNRADCLSMLGMARETAATFDKKVKYPEIYRGENSNNLENYISVEVDTDLCTRYTARVINDVVITNSPWWMQRKLMAAGMRPINNIVDITNFVMLEYGQPLHAFDIDEIENKVIKVETAGQGENFVTLDGVERKLTNDIVMIKDGNKSIAIGGIMGGINSGIKESTNTIVLESANFNADSVRQSSKTLGLRTESSSRFEKGVDANLCKEASDRACYLIQELGYGKVVDGIIDIYPIVNEPVTTVARVSRINKVIGTNLSREDMVEILERLEIDVRGEGDELVVSPKTVRADLLKEVDYIEEIARIYGYDKIPMTFPKEVTTQVENKSWEFRDSVRQILCGLGMNEIQTFSFINHKILDSLNIDDDSWERDLVELINPMGEDTAAMRTILMGGMMEVLKRNFSRNIDEVRAFEIGNTFSPNYIDDADLPFESLNLSLGIYGKDEDFFTLKGIVQELLLSLGFENIIFEPESEYKLFHPGRCARVIADCSADADKKLFEMENRLEESKNILPDEEFNQMRDMLKALKDSQGNGKVELGIMGQIHPEVSERYNIDSEVYCAEFSFDAILRFASKEISYKPLPKYPSMVRDMAVVIDRELLVGNLIDVIKNYQADIVENVTIFDIYEGEQIDEDKKSVALSITYRHNERTLTDEETTKVHNEILELLGREFNAILRDI